MDADDGYGDRGVRRRGWEEGREGLFEIGEKRNRCERRFCFEGERTEGE